MPSTDNERAAIPLYKDDFQTAREKGELDIARLSYQTNVACAKDIDSTIAANHSDNILDTDKIVDELAEKYSGSFEIKKQGSAVEAMCCVSLPETA
jgi:hypothetical protein